MSWTAEDVLRVSRWAALAVTSRGYGEDDLDVDTPDRDAAAALFDSIVEAGVRKGDVSANDAAAWRMRFHPDFKERRPGRLAQQSQPTLRSTRRSVASFIARTLNDSDTPPVELVAAVARTFAALPRLNPPQQAPSVKPTTAAGRKARSRARKHEVADAQRRATAVATQVLDGRLATIEWSDALSAVGGGTSHDAVTEFGRLSEALITVGDPRGLLAAWVAASFAPTESYERAEMLGNVASSLVKAREFRAAVAVAKRRPTPDLRDRPDREARLLEQELLIRLAGGSAHRDEAVRLFRSGRELKQRLTRSGIKTEWEAVLDGRLTQLSYLLGGHERKLARFTLDLAIEALDSGRASVYIRHLQAVRRYAAAALVARAPEHLERALSEAATLCTGSYPDQEERIDILVARARGEPALVGHTGAWRDISEVSPRAPNTLIALSFDRSQDLRWLF